MNLDLLIIHKRKKINGKKKKHTKKQPNIAMNGDFWARFYLSFLIDAVI